MRNLYADLEAEISEVGSRKSLQGFSPFRNLSAMEVFEQGIINPSKFYGVFLVVLVSDIVVWEQIRKCK